MDGGAIDLAALLAAGTGVGHAAILRNGVASASHGFNPDQLDDVARLCTACVSTADGPTLTQLESLPANPLVTGPPHLQCCANWRLSPQDGEAPVDAFIFGPSAFLLDPARAHMLRAVASLVVEHDRTARRTIELERLHAQAVRASRMLRAATEAENISTALTNLVAELCRYHGATIGRIWKLSMPAGTMREISRFEDDGLDEHSYYRRSAMAPVTTTNSFTAAAIEANEPRWMLYSDVVNPERYAMLGIALSAGLKCQVSYPIWVGDERFGVAMSFTRERHDLALVVDDVAALSDIIRPALYRKVTEERLQLLSLALDGTNDAMLITEAGPIEEPGPRILYANPSFYRMTGYSIEEVLGRSPRFLQGPATDRSVLRQIGARLREGQAARAEIENYRKDGSRFWVEMEITPIADSHGRRINLVSVQRDVTVRRTEQQMMLQSEKLKTIGQLTGGVAHDFNNLLTVITLNLEMALTGLADTDPLQDLLQPAMRAAGRGVELTQQLLSYARRSWLRPRPLAMRDVFDTLRPLLARTLSAHFTLQFAVDPAPVFAMVDPAQLDNALLNLIINARDAMPQGGTIRLDAIAVALASVKEGLRDEMQPGRYVRIRVSDRGTGIPPEAIGRVFDPFFTTKDVGKGTGLGLSMVYGFAKQTGGTAAIVSEPGIGTTVTLFLPVCAPLGQATETGAPASVERSLV